MQKTNPSFLSPKQSRQLSATQEKQKKTFRLISELLLKNVFPEQLCREILNGRALFSQENQKAATLISQTLPSFFDQHHSTENPEPISLEAITFVYQFLSQELSPSIKTLMIVQ